MKDIQYSTKIKIVLAFFSVMILYSIFSYLTEKQSLKNSVFVTGRVSYLLMAHGGLVVYVDYYYQGKKYSGDFLTNKVDSIEKNELIVMKISRHPLGEYIVYVKKADKQ